MQHLSIFPVLIPLLFGAIMLLPPISRNINYQRIASVIGTLFMLMSTATLLYKVNAEGVQLYALGGWQAPFGIALVADRVSSLMVLLTSFMSFAIMLYAVSGQDKGGAYFHPLFMFQIMGINGAFLTGDIFNLFVFFEVLLIASYALLIHAGGKQKTQATLHYVILNLVGSSFFLFGLGILYGTLGTLNMADMAIKVGQLQGETATLAKTGALLLLVVFGLKAAMLPMHFWLPKTYASASAPVAALFAIMTKVGIYSIFRVYTVIFGEHAGELANIATPWLWPLALLTITIGSIGVFASPGIKTLSANLVIVSSGSLLACAAINSEEATSAALYYMVHSTLASAALFLLADVMSRQRGKAEDRFVRSRPFAQPRLLGFAFAILALSLVGMPPLSGFVGKIMILQATQSSAQTMWVWPLILLGSLAALIIFSRAGTTLFWRHNGSVTAEAEPAKKLEIAGIALLILASPLLVLFGGDVSEYTQLAASYLHDIQASAYGLLPGVAQ
ncbi:monovalent cation/H+ antiporter subunit D [Marinomonas foliarum]|jgi:multicomponent K+:H+ antiporter subunit D|uniref:Monovalent cation/H+ antiporter subunit D n=1 Tax=Marinomonas foliarum TaxID=491950 RepID=A0A368ZP58_9GAMM|nr:monovalent cation/H+ antiporter subunit D [Marinomonas foliarum]QRV22769.1 monovalent cation/H+ antiporter subunit D [Marinomonas foliarum]RCW94690.1 multisubunit potassium/proton antiporter PhaD subunit [Marinomonas foliarum]